MKVSTEYGTISNIKTNEPNDNRWNFEKGLSFVVTALTIICVIGYIAYELNGTHTVNTMELSNKNDVSSTFGDSFQHPHGEHVYDFDLSSTWHSYITITDCDDDDDISYDGIYGEYSYKQDIQAISNGVTNNWDEFEGIIKKSTHDDTFISCFKKQIISGKINCKISCPSPISVAYQSDDHTINFCEDSSLDLINQQIAPNRRSCIFKEIAYQIGDICQQNQESQETQRISIAAFKWYKAKYSGSKNWRTSDCP